MIRRFVLLPLLVLCCFGLGVPSAFSQLRAKTLQIAPVKVPPTIDGRLDDACWQAIEPTSGFVQYDPSNGTPASETTLVWAAYDETNLYFAFRLEDSRPDRIWAELTPRNGYWDNDSISVVLDTYNDQRTSVSFTVNPRGVQRNSVETIWRSEATQQPDGWSVEIAIPFKSLRFSTGDSLVWGVNFERYIKRLNERDYWTTVDRDRPLLTQMGELRGLSGIRPGRNLELFPYAGARASRWAGDTDNKIAGGVDVKYGLRSNLVLDVTASPDFSEVESDPFLYQLSPYENYLSDHRPFFTEGSQYFETSTGGDHFEGPSFSLFYSRRISDPKLAAKLTGKSGAYSFGVLAAANGGTDGGTEPFTVVRVRRDVLNDSNVGLYFTGSGPEDRRNTNLGVDYNFRYRSIYTLSGFHAVTFNPAGPDGQNGVHMLRLGRQPDAGWNLSASFDRVEKNVSVSTGFVTRTDVQTTAGSAGYGWRLSQGWLKHASASVSGRVVHDTRGVLRGQSGSVSSWLSFHPEVSLWIDASAGRSRDQITLDDGTLAWSDRFVRTRKVSTGLFWSRSGFLKGMRASVDWGHAGIYSEDFTRIEPGHELHAGGSVTFRPRSHIEVETDASWVRQTVDGTGAVVFSGLTYTTSLHYQVTRALFFSSRMQGETRESQYSVDAVAGYYFGAGNVFQVTYKKGSRVNEAVRERGDAITAKVSYLFRR